MFETQNFAILIFITGSKRTGLRHCFEFVWYTVGLRDYTGLPAFLGICLYFVIIRYWYTAFIWIGIGLGYGVVPFLNEFRPCDCRQKLHIAGVPLQDFRTTGWPAPRKINMQGVLPSKPCLIFIKYPSAHVIAGLQISTQQGRCFSSQK